MKAYLGLRDPARAASAGTLFGIDLGERNFVRLRAAA
jgi:hypothetical protein